MLVPDNRRRLCDSIEVAVQTPNTYQLNLQYHQATHVLEEARDEAEDVYTLSGKDPEFWSLVIGATQYADGARAAEGAISDAKQSLPLLELAAKDYRNLLESLTKYNDSDEAWERAAIEERLGNVLTAEGERLGGEKGASQFEEAVEHYRSALGIFDKLGHPEQWTILQYDLGYALLSEAKGSGEDRSKALLEQSIQTYQNLLEMESKSENPND